MFDVAHAERALIDQADDADRRPRRAPATTSSGSAALRTGLRSSRRTRRDADGDTPDDRAEHHVDEQRGERRVLQRRHREVPAPIRRYSARVAGGDGRRERDRNERARTIFEQQQFDREQHRGHGTAERRRHARRGAGGEQRLSLVGRDVNDLPDQRAERAAGRDDRTFGAEWSAGADRDRRRERLEEHDLRRDLAAVVEHPLHDFRNAVAANRRRAVARHHADDRARRRRESGSTTRRDARWSAG